MYLYTADKMKPFPQKFVSHFPSYLTELKRLPAPWRENQGWHGEAKKIKAFVMPTVARVEDSKNRHQDSDETSSLCDVPSGQSTYRWLCDKYGR